MFNDQQMVMLELAGTRSPEDIAVFYHYFANTNGRRSAIVVYILGVIASLTVLLRLYTRLAHNPNSVVKRLKADDWLIVAAWICFLVSICLGAIQFESYGLGAGMTGVFLKGKPTELLETLYFGAISYLMAMSFSKFSILALYWTVMNSLKHVRPYLLACTWFQVLATVAQLGWSLFSCYPVEQQFDIRLINNRCRLKTMYELIGVFIFTTISDVMLMMLSIPLLRSLKLPVHEKFGIFSMFALTLVTLAASTARTVVLVKNQDLTELVVWGFVESSVGIVVACIPALRSLFGKFKRKAAGRMKLEDTEDQSAACRSFMSI